MPSPSEGNPADNNAGQPVPPAAPSPFAGTPPPLSDPIAQAHASLSPIDLSVGLDDDAKRRLARRLDGMIAEYEQRNMRRRENLNVWRMAVEMFPPGASTRWENSSDVPSSLTAIVCNSHHTRLNNQLLGAVPPFAAVAKEPDALEAAPLIEECMTAVLEAADWPQVCDDKNRELVVAGNVFLRATYEREYASIPQTLVDLDEETIDMHIRAGAPLLDAVGHGTKGVRFGFTDEPIYDGVKFRVINWEDGIILPARIRDPAEAVGIGERRMVSGFDLVEGARRGTYDPDAVADLLRKPGDPEPLDRMQRLDEQGQQPGFGTGDHGGDAEDALYRDYQLYELCWKMAPPPGTKEEDDTSPERPTPQLAGWPQGRAVWTVIHYHRPTRTILAHHYLEYRHGRPYYQLQRYIRRPNELWGMGIAEYIAGLHDADTAVRNQLIDYGDWCLNWAGNIAYTGLSGYDPDEAILQFGRGIKMEDLQEFKQLQIPPMPTQQYQLRQSFRDEVDLLTASSNPTLGKETTGDKTLGEVQIVQSAAHSIFEDYSGRVARQDADLWDQARWLTAQYGLRTDGGQIRYRRTAMPDQVAFSQIDPLLLSAKVDLVPAGLQQLSDMGSRVQMATLILAQVQTYPLVRSNIEVQRIAWEVYLRAMKYTQLDKILAATDRGIQAQQQVQQLEMAHAAMGGGMTPSGGGPPPGPPGGPGGEPPGTVGGPPAPIPSAPQLPPGGAMAQNTMPAPEPEGSP